MITIDFTYQSVTPESACIGDFADNGFCTEYGQPVTDQETGHSDYERNQWKQGDLRYFIEKAQALGITEDTGDWFSTADDQINDYSTGEAIGFSMHIGGVTQSTYQRIKRLLTSH